MTYQVLYTETNSRNVLVTFVLFQVHVFDSLSVKPAAKFPATLRLCCSVTYQYILVPGYVPMTSYLVYLDVL